MPTEQSIAYEENWKTIRATGWEYRVCVPSSRRNLRVYYLRYITQHLPLEET